MAIRDQLEGEIVAAKAKIKSVEESTTFSAELARRLS